MSTENVTGPDKGSKTLSDADISTERVLQRRSFLTATGVLVGGALAIAAGVGRAADGADPNQPDPPTDRTGDPDKRKRRLEPTDPDKRVTDPDRRRVTDPERRASDPQRPTDPARKIPQDPKPPDP
jgi:hypothetical protein